MRAVRAVMMVRLRALVCLAARGQVFAGSRLAVLLNWCVDTPTVISVRICQKCQEHVRSDGDALNIHIWSDPSFDGGRPDRGRTLN